MLDPVKDQIKGNETERLDGGTVEMARTYEGWHAENVPERGEEFSEK